MALRLRDGARLVVEIEQTDKGFAVTIARRVGKHAKVLSTKAVDSEEAMWLTVIRWAETRLAKLGLEKT